MSAFTVKRTYKQLMAERNAMRLMIQDKENHIKHGERTATHDHELQELEIAKSQLESDKVLLNKIEDDIQSAREAIDEGLPTRLEGSD